MVNCNVPAEISFTKPMTGKNMNNNNFTEKVHKTINLADYQIGSVVSRTIINQKTGAVTFFAFDEGQKLSEHTAPYDAMVQVLEGEAEIIIGGIQHILKGGDLIIMPANISHSLNANKRFKMLLTMIRS